MTTRDHQRRILVDNLQGRIRKKALEDLRNTHRAVYDTLYTGWKVEYAAQEPRPKNVSDAARNQTFRDLIEMYPEDWKNWRAYWTAEIYAEVGFVDQRPVFNATLRKDPSATQAEIRSRSGPGKHTERFPDGRFKPKGQ